MSVGLDVLLVLRGALDKQRAGDMAGALADYDKVLGGQPAVADAWNLSGAALVALGRPEEAVERIERALTLRPDRPGYLSNLGVAYQKSDRLAEAIEMFEKAVALDPKQAEARRNLGLLAAHAQDFPSAETHFRAALTVAPTHAVCMEDLGGILLASKRYGEAENMLASAQRLGWDSATLRAKIAMVLQETGRQEQANQVFLDAVAAYPEDPELLSWALKPLYDQALWDEAAALLPRARELTDTHSEGVPIQPLLAIALGEPLARVHKAAEKRATAMARTAVPLPRPARPVDKSRLTIGYLSSDFHDHATLHLMAGVFREHDRSRFEIRCYAGDADDGGAYRRDLIDRVDGFTSIGAMGARQAAERMIADGVDVLVDLKGHTQDTRLDVAAYRPAPVAMHYLGYPGSLAADYVDYFIADPVTVPEQGRDEFSEAVIRLPGCYQCTDDQRPVSGEPGNRSDWGLPEHGLVLGAFNALYKVRPELFDLWLGLLNDLPDAVLWLFSPSGSVRRRLEARAERIGVPKDRLIWASRVPPQRHLARLRHVDLALDSWPYGAHTTAADLLWAGVPLVTVCGDRFAARVATAILTAAEMPDDLICHDKTEYRRRVLDLAADPVRLAEIRAKAEAARHSPHFDTKAKTRSLEAAYTTAFERHLADLPPADFDL